YTYGPLIHNPQTVELLRERGIVPVDSVDSIRDGIVVIRAHGISPQEKERIREKGIEIVDATCPRVASVQAIIKKHAARGYAVIIVGDREHPEVASLMGYASGRGVVINDTNDVDGLTTQTMSMVFPPTIRCALLRRRRRIREDTGRWRRKSAADFRRP
ncbi:MAG: hypothetical protein JRD89_11105, partial [Deltaproteobacteria bacterium]|nr:hypothetical protein [Deltaproteobacteria bacterium]